MTTATVLSGPERRRRWTAAEKARIVEESLAAGASITEVARRHDVHRNLLDAWRRQARAGTLVRAGARTAFDGAGFSRVVVAPDTRMLCAPQSEAGAGRVCIEVVLRNGRVLRVPEDVLPARVSALADALEGSGR